MNFAELAKLVVPHRIPVIPLRSNTKVPASLIKHGASDASLAMAQIHMWNRLQPNSNCGAVARPDGCWMLDVNDQTALDRLLAQNGQTKHPRTFTVRASRGPHFYFRQDDVSRAMGNVFVPGLFEACVDNKYVVGPGSFVSETEPVLSQKRYELVQNIPPVVAPTWLTHWLGRQKPALTMIPDLVAMPELARSKKTNNKAGVYFLYSNAPVLASQRMVKIGSGETLKRKRELQTGNPYELISLGFIAEHSPGTRLAQEKALHAKFNHLVGPIGEEWFSLNDEILFFIRDHTIKVHPLVNAFIDAHLLKQQVAEYEQVLRSAPPVSLQSDSRPKPRIEMPRRKAGDELSRIDPTTSTEIFLN